MLGGLLVVYCVVTVVWFCVSIVWLLGFGLIVLCFRRLWCVWLTLGCDLSLVGLIVGCVRCLDLMLVCLVTCGWCLVMFVVFGVFVWCCFVGFVDLRLVFVLVCGGVGGCVRRFGWVCLVVTFGFIYLVVLC